MRQQPLERRQARRVGSSQVIEARQEKYGCGHGESCRLEQNGYRNRMRLTLENRPGANLVTHLGPGGIRVGERRFDRSLILSATDLLPEWDVDDPAQLGLDSLAPALGLGPGAGPEILLLGTGTRIVFPAAEIFAALAARGVGLEVMDTAAACRTYNVLVGEERSVVAALILP